MKGFMGVLLLKEEEGEKDKRERSGAIFLGMVFVNLPEHFPTWPRTFFSLSDTFLMFSKSQLTTPI